MRRLSLLAATLVALSVSSFASAVVLQPGDLLVADESDHVLRVDPASGAQEEVASGGFLSGTSAVAVDLDGHVLVGNVAPGNTSSVVRIDRATGTQTQIFQTEGQIVSLAVASDGDLLIGMGLLGPGSIVRFDESTGTSSTVASGGLITGGVFGIAIATEDHLFATSGGNLIRVDLASGDQVEVGTDLGGGPVAVMDDGSILVLFFCETLMRVDEAGQILQETTFEPTGGCIAGGVALEASGDIVVATGGGLRRIDAQDWSQQQEITSGGLILRTWGVAVYASPAACRDGNDNDGDQLIDYGTGPGNDPGCASPNSGIENPECNDGVNNDLDLLVDLNDPGCANAADASEGSGLACDDGVDNDGDGRTDYPSDPGCSGAGDSSEKGSLACDDDVDNDRDGRTDYPGDPGCVGPADASEADPPPPGGGGCGLGVELVPVLLALRAMRNGRAARRT